MGTKVKGILKGIKSFSSQIFDDEKDKEPEIQIGGPTDVKHLSHIGCDGPAMESPSWMKEFDTTLSQSGPLDITGTMVESPEVNWVSEDSGHRRGRRNGSRHRSSRSVETSRDAPLLPRSSRNRRRSMDNNGLETESQGRIRHPRRHQSEGRAHTHSHKSGDDTTTDAPKKSIRRRHRTKEESSSEGPTRSPAKSTADESDIGSDNA